MEAQVRLKTSIPSSGRQGPWLLAAVLAAGLVLRLWGARWGFPLLFNGDEPHFVDTAVSFGAGSLNPHEFKYPTLWMYALSVAYGFYYLAWSLFGLRRGVLQFGGLFVWQAWRFHLLGRLLSAAFSVAGLWVVARIDKDGRESAPLFPWAAALLAVSPALVSSAHEAKPDSLMFLLSGLAWLFSLRTLRDGRRGDTALGGLCAGLAFSSQYTALPALLLIPLASALRVGAGREAPGRALELACAGVAASGVGFFLGCPFAFLDFPAFRSSLAEHAAYHAEASAAWDAWKNPFLFAGPWSLAALALPAGVARLWSRDRRRLALLAVPILLWTAFLSRQHDGQNIRYLYACFPALALLAAEGLDAARAPGPLAAAAALALMPGLWSSCAADRVMTLPDTRLAATAWIEANVPQGATILLDQADVSPAARMTREQAEELRSRNAAAGSLRARYYALLRDSHPGGGWRVYHLKRSALDLNTNPALVERAQREGDYVDASAGLSAARDAGVWFVVTSSDGARPERAPELARFFAELARDGETVARFEPDGKSSVGPALRIYRISHGGT